MTALPDRLRRWLAALALLATLPAFAAPAFAADVELPPVDEVFVLSAQATSRDRIEVRWQIADKYYLYRHRTSVKADASFTGATLALPKGKAYRDEFFGDVETYRQQLIGSLTGVPASGATTATLTVKYQGCADAGICYPPQTRTLKVTLPGAAGDEGGGFGFGNKKSGLFGLGDADAGATDALPLPAEQAFTSEVIAGDGNTLLLRLTPARGYYLYRDKLSLRLEAGKGLSATLPSAAKLPKATPYRDEHFGNVAVYFDQVEIAVPVARTVADAARGTLVLGLQGCQDGGICYPPMTRRLAVSLPAGTVTPAGEVAPAEGLDAPAATADADAINAVDTDNAPADDAPVPEAMTAPAGEAERTPPPQQQTHGLLASLLLALFGGLILNLMPCVLPVLSLKALSLAQSGASRESARRHALAYTAGVMVSFAALGALALALRKAGLALGWGFQLQQPLVVALLALVVFAFGLSLSGLWHANVGIGQRGSALVQGDGTRADFFTGVLAVVLATPCTAPFMGAALAYAFTGPTLGGMLVFLMLGLGLALPFLLIGFVPAFARLLPKPGAWMETLKQLLAFPMYATAAWLVWVLAKQRGADAAGLWMAAAIALALGAWAWTRVRTGGGRGWLAVALVALLGTAWPLSKLHQLPKPEPTAAATTHSGIASVAFSERALADLRAQGRVVFVNMTADWCVSCKANEKTVFAREGFRKALEAANAVYMVGDYTDVDPAITGYLERHKAVGVPLYVVYPAGGGEGRILPVILTPAIADDALALAAGAR